MDFTTSAVPIALLRTATHDSQLQCLVWNTTWPVCAGSATHCAFMCAWLQHPYSMAEEPRHGALSWKAGTLLHCGVAPVEKLAGGSSYCALCSGRGSGFCPLPTGWLQNALHREWGNRGAFSWQGKCSWVLSETACARENHCPTDLGKIGFVCRLMPIQGFG